jgi:hypothetical protein
MKKTLSKCFVQNLSTPERQNAYLCGFDEDKAVLKECHLTYLRRIVLDAQRLSAIKISTHQNAVYRIWLLGTTSRTASFAYNLNLSRRRAQVVAPTLNQAFKNLDGHPVPYVRDTEGMSETVALLRGRPDDTADDPLDRAVLRGVEWVTIPTPKPPVIQRPAPKTLPKTFWKAFKNRGACCLGLINPRSWI